MVGYLYGQNDEVSVDDDDDDDDDGETSPPPPSSPNTTHVVLSTQNLLLTKSQPVAPDRIGHNKSPPMLNPVPAVLKQLTAVVVVGAGVIVGKPSVSCNFATHSTIAFSAPSC